MSIDKQVFVELVGELETYYKREFTPFVSQEAEGQGAGGRGETPYLKAGA